MSSDPNGGGMRPKVVILGGSFAGRRAHRMLLAGGLDVTLIDSKGFFEYTPAALRCMVHPSHASSTLLPQPPGTITATATAVMPAPGNSGGFVELTDGSQLRYDFCLIATGSSYIAPIRPDETLPVKGLSSIASRCSQLEAACMQLGAAKRVAVVGGGTVGVELAAEVIGRWPGKTVTLVASQERLLARMPHAASAYALKWLQGRGVEVVLGERITDWGDSRSDGVVALTTDQGRRISADLLYRCIGFKANTEVAAQLLAAAGSSRDAAEVSPQKSLQGIPVMATMQVAGHPCVFAAGDCSSSEEEKTALSADLAATCAAKNILRLAKGQSGTLTFPEGVCHGGLRVPDVVVVSLYKYHAVMQFNRLIISGRLAAMVKLLVEFFQMQVAAGSWFWNAIWEQQESLMIWLGTFLFTTTDVYIPLL